MYLKTGTLRQTGAPCAWVPSNDFTDIPFTTLSTFSLSQDESSGSFYFMEQGPCPAKLGNWSTTSDSSVGLSCLVVKDMADTVMAMRIYLTDLSQKKKKKA